MRNPPPPIRTGNPQKDHFWNWAAKSLIELQPRMGPGLLLDQTTRGTMLRRMLKGGPTQEASPRCQCLFTSESVFQCVFTLGKYGSGIPVDNFIHRPSVLGGSCTGLYGEETSFLNTSRFHPKIVGDYDAFNCDAAVVSNRFTNPYNVRITTTVGWDVSSFQESAYWFAPEFYTFGQPEEFNYQNIYDEDLPTIPNGLVEVEDGLWFGLFESGNGYVPELFACSDSIIESEFRYYEQKPFFDKVHKSTDTGQRESYKAVWKKAGSEDDGLIIINAGLKTSGNIFLSGRQGWFAIWIKASHMPCVYQLGYSAAFKRPPEDAYSGLHNSFSFVPEFNPIEYPNAYPRLSSGGFIHYKQPYAPGAGFGSEKYSERTVTITAELI